MGLWDVCEAWRLCVQASQPGQASDGVSGDMQDEPAENGFHENGLPPARKVCMHDMTAVIELGDFWHVQSCACKRDLGMHVSRLQ